VPARCYVEPARPSPAAPGVRPDAGASAPLAGRAAERFALLPGAVRVRGDAGGFVVATARADPFAGAVAAPSLPAPAAAAEVTEAALPLLEGAPLAARPLGAGPGALAEGARDATDAPLADDTRAGPGAAADDLTPALGTGPDGLATALAVRTAPPPGPPPGGSAADGALLGAGRREAARSSGVRGGAGARPSTSAGSAAVGGTVEPVAAR
jgi:hypothetical protein